ncbi:MAG: phosphoenolpyruvate carboxykinase (ATP) [Calditrichaeota bacterium]|nr:phosphoenolpyruvate carboxykinase (ATP) [Calditrichota bacterium]
MSSHYDERAYRQFAELLPVALSGKNIKHCKVEDLAREAYRHGRRCKNGAWGWRSFVSSRIGPKTVYLGSPSVVLPNPTALHKDIIAQAPDQLHKILQLARKLPMVHIRCQMGRNNEFNPICNLYMSVNDRKNIRTPYMWGHTMSPVDKRRPGPEFTMIHIPEEHQIRQMVLALPEYGINICLGSDYMGEEKKGFLRQAMYWADEHSMLGLHAGTKMVTARDGRDGKLKKTGVFLFGLSATGKSTWSCHRLGLEEDKGEGTEVIQDDIVFLKKDGSAYGSEANFFVKTDVDPQLQEAMWWSLTDKSAFYENVMVDADGNPDFLDESLCGNGRAVIRKDKLRVRRGKKLVSIAYPSFDLPPTEALDGVIFAFITRRNTVMPFAQELTPEQAVLAYLWGESTHSYASQPEKAGESVRTVGTDPFIVGKRGPIVNRFRDIVMGLVDRYPGKVRFFQYNTGGVGEIIEAIEGSSRKKMIRKAARVPIPLMAAIQRGDLRGTNRYEMGRYGTKQITSVEGWDLSPFEPERFYDKDQIDKFVTDIVAGRRRFTEEIAAEGLDRQIIKWAEESYKLGVHEEPKIWAVEAEIKKAVAPSIFAPIGGNGGGLYRPPRSLGWRVK